MNETISTKLEQIVSLNGNISIDVFKNFKLPDDSKLSLNCHGDNKDSMLFNCPNGGIFCNSSDFNIESLNTIDLNSSNYLKINSKNIIEIGDHNCNILVNKENSSLDFTFNDKKNSYIKLDTNFYSVINKYNSLTINEKSYNLRSNKLINLGNIYNNTLSVDCENDKININGDLYLNGNMFIKKLVECKNISNIITNNDLIFKIINNPNKNWSIKDDNNNGIFYKDKYNRLDFKQKNNFLNLACKSINLFNNIDNNNYINICDKFYINNNCDIFTQGSITISEDLNINNTIKLNNKGFIEVENDIIIDNYHISNLFRYSVGLNYRYSNIQDCINYIVENEFYKNGPIYIEIYPNKEYLENIKINHYNINLIGKYQKINIKGSINILLDNIEESSIMLKNLSIESSLNTNNNFILKKSNIIFKNVNFTLKDSSSIIINSLDIIFNNCKFIGKVLNIENSYNIKNINSSFDINKIVNSNNISYRNCYLKINNNNLWKIIVNESVIILHSEIVSDINLDIFKNKIFCSKNIIILDSILKLNNLDGIFYPRLLLQSNYKI